MADTLYIDALPAGIRSSFIDNGNGLSMHVLEAGRAGQPSILLLPVSYTHLTLPTKRIV